MEDLENLNLTQFHVKDESGSALCGAKVNFRLADAFATNPREITCLDCMRLAYIRSLQAQPAPEYQMA